MLSTRQQRIEKELDKLFHLSVRSDGTVAIVLDRRFDVFPVTVTPACTSRLCMCRRTLGHCRPGENNLLGRVEVSYA